MGLITSLINNKNDDGKSGGGLVGAIVRSKTKPYDPMAEPDSYKRGGIVKKTGMAKVHKGERMLTKSQNKRYSKKSGK